MYVSTQNRLVSSLYVCSTLSKETFDKLILLAKLLST